MARPRERRLPREVLRLHDIIVSSGGIEWAQQAAIRICGSRGARVRRLGIRGRACKVADLEWLRACVDYLVTTGRVAAMGRNQRPHIGVHCGRAIVRFETYKRSE